MMSALKKVGVLGGVAHTIIVSTRQLYGQNG